GGPWPRCDGICSSGRRNGCAKPPRSWQRPHSKIGGNGENRCAETPADDLADAYSGSSLGNDQDPRQEHFSGQCSYRGNDDIPKLGLPSKAQEKCLSGCENGKDSSRYNS